MDEQRTGVLVLPNTDMAEQRLRLPLGQKIRLVICRNIVKPD
ncbi:hypothetical protein [Lacrimispora amygdalina]